MTKTPALALPSFRPTTHRDLRRALQLSLRASAEITRQLSDALADFDSDYDEPYSDFISSPPSETYLASLTPAQLEHARLTDQILFADDSGDDLSASLDILNLTISILNDANSSDAPAANLAFIFDCLDIIHATDDDSMTAYDELLNPFYALTATIDPKFDYPFFACLDMI